MTWWILCPAWVHREMYMNNDAYEQGFALSCHYYRCTLFIYLVIIFMVFYSSHQNTFPVN